METRREPLYRTSVLLYFLNLLSRTRNTVYFLYDVLPISCLAVEPRPNGCRIGFSLLLTPLQSQVIMIQGSTTQSITDYLMLDVGLQKNPRDTCLASSSKSHFARRTAPSIMPSFIQRRATECHSHYLSA